MQSLKIVVGIDLSLTRTAVCLFREDEDEPSNLVVQSDKQGMYRVREIAAMVMDHIRMNAGGVMFNELYVFVEGYAFARPQQAHFLGELGGVIRDRLITHGIPYIDVPPTKLKKFVTGKGNANKEQMAVGTYKRWGREFATNDEVDAFALAMLGWAVLHPENDGHLTAFQREIVESIRRQMNV